MELAPPKVKHGHNTGKVFNRELKETVKAVLSFLREEDNFAAEFLEKGAPPALYYWYRLALGSESEKDLVRFLAYRPLPGLVPLVGKTGEIPAGQVHVFTANVTSRDFNVRTAHLAAKVHLPKPMGEGENFAVCACTHSSDARAARMNLIYVGRRLVADSGRLRPSEAACAKKRGIWAHAASDGTGTDPIWRRGLVRNAA